MLRHYDKNSGCVYRLPCVIGWLEALPATYLCLGQFRPSIFQFRRRNRHLGLQGLFPPPRQGKVSQRVIELVLEGLHLRLNHSIGEGRVDR